MKFLIQYRGPMTGLKYEWRKEVRNRGEFKQFMTALKANLKDLDEKESITIKKEEI